MFKRGKFLFSVFLIGLFSRVVFAQNLVPAETSRFSIIYEEGLKLLSAERYAEAARKFETAVKLNPADAKGYNALGTVYVHLSRHKEAYLN